MAKTTIAKIQSNNLRPNDRLLKNGAANEQQNPRQIIGKAKCCEKKEWST